LTSKEPFAQPAALPLRPRPERSKELSASSSLTSVCDARAVRCPRLFV
jgi:hypothetical protein